MLWWCGNLKFFRKRNKLNSLIKCCTHKCNRICLHGERLYSSEFFKCEEILILVMKELDAFCLCYYSSIHICKWGPNTKTTRQTACKEIEIRISWIFLSPAELTKLLKTYLKLNVHSVCMSRYVIPLISIGRNSVELKIMIYCLLFREHFYSLNYSNNVHKHFGPLSAFVRICICPTTLCLTT